MDHIHKQRFTAKIRLGGPDDCWEWQAGKSEGYGMFHVDRKPYRSHRLAWEEAHGPIPPGMEVLHRCDNRVCCNPAHLFLGTKADNIRDAKEKGRQARGGMLPQTKLTLEQVAEIRQRWAEGGWRQKDLGAEYGVSQTTISDVLTGRGGAWGASVHQKVRDDYIDPAVVKKVVKRYFSSRISQTDLAKEFGLGQTTVSRIIRGVWPKRR